MKSEKEIRKHRDDLRICLAQRCGCSGTRHEFECYLGGKMIQATIETLSWLLDESVGMDRLVEEISKRAKE